MKNKNKYWMINEKGEEGFFESPRHNKHKDFNKLLHKISKRNYCSIIREDKNTKIISIPQFTNKKILLLRITSSGDYNNLYKKRIQIAKKDIEYHNFNILYDYIIGVYEHQNNLIYCSSPEFKYRKFSSEEITTLIWINHNIIKEVTHKNKIHKLGKNGNHLFLNTSLGDLIYTLKKFNEHNNKNKSEIVDKLLYESLEENKNSINEENINKEKIKFNINDEVYHSIYGNGVIKYILNKLSLIKFNDGHHTIDLNDENLKILENMNDYDDEELDNSNGESDQELDNINDENNQDLNNINGESDQDLENINDDNTNKKKIKFNINDEVYHSIYGNGVVAHILNKAYLIKFNDSHHTIDLNDDNLKILDNMNDYGDEELDNLNVELDNINDDDNTNEEQSDHDNQELENLNQNIQEEEILDNTIYLDDLSVLSNNEELFIDDNYNIDLNDDINGEIMDLPHEIGYAGEAYIFKLFQEQNEKVIGWIKDFDKHKLIWNNQISESGKPYDMIYDDNLYIEIKSSIKNNNFIMSSNEYNFMKNHENYILIKLEERIGDKFNYIKKYNKNDLLELPNEIIIKKVYSFKER